MLELADKDIKIIIITRSYLFKQLDEILNILSRGLENTQTQIKLLETKTAMSEKKKLHQMKSVMKSIDITEEKIS